LLGLSKNTVDSVLHILRSRAASLEKTLQDEAGLNQSPDYQKNFE
jgi:hypothetical protein